MDRFGELRRFVDQESLGIEVAPYFAPIVPKADGYNVLTVDVFDTDTLRKNALSDPKIPNKRIGQIEEVDIVSDASQLIDVVQTKGLSGKVKYIVSSHNFEHLPDPISFLRGCSTALMPGGVLTMALPDYRACYDHFRMPTRLSDWLAAFYRGDTQPSPETVFDSAVNRAAFMRGDDPSTDGLDIASESPDGFRPVENLRAAHATYVADLETTPPYRDTHCNLMFGASFELLVRDLRHLGLIDLELIEITPTVGLEFIVHLQKPVVTETTEESDEAFYSRRLELLREVNLSLGSAGLLRKSAISLSLSTKKAARGILGSELYSNLKTLNSQRLAKRKNGNS
ncbi:MAG: adenine phosphoribosyltransferase [Rhodobacteraceae bacterium]|nr:adenine phosphoribosyltransferase [Paracoccaceae bacterium]